MSLLSSQLKGMLFLTGAFALAGTSVISAMFVAGRLGTFTITAVSLFFALLLLVPLAGRSIIESIRDASARDWAYLFLQAVFGIFLFCMFLLLGLLHTTSAEAGILTGATPAITAVLAGLLLKEKMGACKIIGILSTVVGIIFVQGLLMPGKCFMTEHISGNRLNWERIGESKCLRSKMNCLKHQASVWQAFLSCRASATFISAKRWTRQDASWKRKSGRGTGRCPGRN